jgi:anthranilate synthase component I
MAEDTRPGARPDASTSESTVAGNPPDWQAAFSGIDARRFAELAAEGYNRVPVVFEALADLDTPLSTYLKLARGPYSYLLESAQGGEKWGRYSIIGLPCRTVIRVSGHAITVSTDGRVVEALETSDPLSFIEAFQARYKVPDLPELPRFYGGLVGYFGYDCVRYVEPRLAGKAPPDTLGTPDIVLMVSEDVVVFDNLKGRMQLISLVDPSEPGIYQRTLERLQERSSALSAGGATHPGIERQPAGDRERLPLGVRRGAVQAGRREDPRIHPRG